MLRIDWPVRLVALALLMAVVPASASDYDGPPIHYPKAPAHNVITELQSKIALGKTKLHFVEDQGYLPSLLRELKVPVSSQVLVFSKTSLQRDKITPRTPRALYFNDDVYIGFCLRGDVCEVSAVDPDLGTVFYTLDQEPADKPRFQRHTDNCLICHASSLTRGVPGHLIRSVFSDPQGQPILSAGTFRIDHSSPLKERWGGWYVTGKHGRQTHMGNRIIQDRQDANNDTVYPSGQNQTDVRSRFVANAYLSPHSDIVALMVLEHQAQMHNLIARATLEARSALHYQQELIRAMNEPKTTQYDSVKSRIRTVGEDLLSYLLFHEEAALTDAISGTSRFQEEFEQRGPSDHAGRSLRQFDLRTRLFRYRCSYQIYSKAFDGMPDPLRQYVWKRLHEVLTGQDTSERFAYLPMMERKAILEILIATKPNRPDFFR